MSTVIIVPQSSTTSHEFRAITPAGRAMTISVRANRDISDEAVFHDLQHALSSNTAETLQAGTELTVWSGMGAVSVVWIGILVGGLLLNMLLDAAGFVSYKSSLWVWLLRLWLICLPFLVVIGGVIGKKASETNLPVR